jgi:hypothetical protein
MTAPDHSMLEGAPRFYESLLQLARDGAQAKQIAELAVRKWRTLDNELSPIIGHGGVAALFKRSVSLTRPAHVWLASLHDGADQPHTFDGLESILCQQTGSEAAAAAIALLHKFVELLTRLIGDSLTERLLRSVWDNTSSDGAVQETSR